jgi:putative phosphoesterase
MVETVIGVISDTHGLLRPAARRALDGSSRILHAGDIGEEMIFKLIGGVAPVTAVRGNVDRLTWAQRLPEKETVEINGVWIHMLHDVLTLDLDPKAAGISVVIYGHTHKPTIEWKDGVLFFNPGSAGPKRHQLPVSIGRLRIREGVVKPELIDLER